MDEPIRHFYSITGFDRKEIREYVIGEKYLAIMRHNGDIGVCATLGTVMNDSLLREGDPDPDNPVHRIILNAYFNSIYNYQREYTDVRDIFDRIDFSNQRKIVMVGYFETLFQKFSENKIPLEVFDIHKESNILTDINKMEERLSNAGTIILTGTTVFNNTFKNIIPLSAEKCDIFLLGPSNIMSEEMFRYRNIKVVFGSVFANSDYKVLEKIAAGHGTRGFLPYLRKVYIVNEEYRNEIS